VDEGEERELGGQAEQGVMLALAEVLLGSCERVFTQRDE